MIKFLFPGFGGGGGGKPAALPLPPTPAAEPAKAAAPEVKRAALVNDEDNIGSGAGANLGDGV
jgi:hypothetical protein